MPDFPKPGINFKDITTLLLDQQLSSEIIDTFINRLKDKKVDAIVGVESRGFLFGFLLIKWEYLSFQLENRENYLEKL